MQDLLTTSHDALNKVPLPEEDFILPEMQEDRLTTSTEDTLNKKVTLPEEELADCTPAKRQKRIIRAILLHPTSDIPQFADVNVDKSGTGVDLASLLEYLECKYFVDITYQARLLWKKKSTLHNTVIYAGDELDKTNSTPNKWLPSIFGPILIFGCHMDDDTGLEIENSVEESWVDLLCKTNIL